MKAAGFTAAGVAGSLINDPGRSCLNLTIRSSQTFTTDKGLFIPVSYLGHDSPLDLKMDDGLIPECLGIYGPGGRHLLRIRWPSPLHAYAMLEHQTFVCALKHRSQYEHFGPPHNFMCTCCSESVLCVCEYMLCSLLVRPLYA